MDERINAMQGTVTDADLFIYDNDTVFRVWSGREEGQTLDSPALLRAMIVVLMKENARLAEENKDLQAGA